MQCPWESVSKCVGQDEVAQRERARLFKGGQTRTQDEKLFFEQLFEATSDPRARQSTSSAVVSLMKGQHASLER